MNENKENIDIGIVTKSFVDISLIIKIIPCLKSIFDFDYEIYSINNWQWDDYKLINLDSKTLIESNKILIYEINKDINIGIYHYLKDNNYVLNFWVNIDYFNEFYKIIDSYIKEFEKSIIKVKDQINLSYSYIGIETYIADGYGYDYMIENSNGVLKWIK